MARPRVFICSDIFGDDKDDAQSFIRLLFYLNKIDLKGFSCSYPAAHTHAANLIAMIEDRCAANMNFLRAIDPAYPTPLELTNLVYQGKGATGAPANGADTPGSNALIAAALDASPSDPLWVLNWGPYGDLAQALYDDASIIPNIRVFGISHSSGYNYTADNEAADYINNNLVPGQAFDDLWMIGSNSTFRGIYCGPAGENFPNRDWAPVYAWGHGDLGDLYGDMCWDMQFDGTNAGAKEGDTPSLLYVIDNHLARGNGDDPTQAGWGGRYQRDLTLGLNYWKDIPSGQTLGSYPGANTVRIWQTDIWNDLAAKFDLLNNPTIYAAETLSNLTSTDTTIAGRSSVPSGHTWTNFRADRPMNAQNSNNQDYIVGTSGSTSSHYLNVTPPQAEYTVETLNWRSTTAGNPGVSINVNGSDAGGDGKWHAFFMNGDATGDWRLNRLNAAGALDDTISVTQASSISIALNEFYRSRLTRLNNGDGTAQLKSWGRKISGGGFVPIHNYQETSPSTWPAGKPGIRGNLNVRVAILVARSNPGIVCATWHEEGADTVAATGSVGGSGATGSLSVTETPDTLAATGSVRVSGSAAVTEGADTISAVGAVQNRGVVAATEGADAVAATGSVRVTGTVNVTEGPDTVSASSSSQANAVVLAPEDPDTVSATGSVRVSGTAATIDGADTAIMSGSVRVSGVIAVGEGADLVASSGSVPVSGIVAANDNADTVVAIGSVRASGSLVVAEAADVLVASGSVRVSGIVLAEEIEDTLVATAEIVLRPLPPPSRRFHAPRRKIWRAA